MTIRDFSLLRVHSYASEKGRDRQMDRWRHHKVEHLWPNVSKMRGKKLKRMDIIVGFALWENKTQNGCFIGSTFDQAALFISECAGVGVPRGHHWEVRQCGCNQGGRAERRSRGRIWKMRLRKTPGGLTFWFSLSLCSSGQMIPGVGQ